MVTAAPDKPGINVYNFVIHWKDFVKAFCGETQCDDEPTITFRNDQIIMIILAILSNAINSRRTGGEKRRDSESPADPFSTSTNKKSKGVSNAVCH